MPYVALGPVRYAGGVPGWRAPVMSWKPMTRLVGYRCRKASCQAHRVGEVEEVSRRGLAGTDRPVVARLDEHANYRIEHVGRDRSDARDRLQRREKRNRIGRHEVKSRVAVLVLQYLRARMGVPIRVEVDHGAPSAALASENGFNGFVGKSATGSYSPATSVVVI